MFGLPPVDEIGLPFPIVRVEMMADMVHPVGLFGREQREARKQSGNEIIPESTLQQSKMRRLLRQAGQPMLNTTDENDDQHGHGYTPEPR